MSFAFEKEVTEREPNLPNQVIPKMYMENEQKIYWICDYDEMGKITSVFFKKGENDRFSAYIENEEEVLKMEEQLVNAGWIKCKKPQINFNFDK